MTKEVLLENLKQYPTVLQQLIYLTNIVGDIAYITDYTLMSVSQVQELINSIFD